MTRPDRSNRSLLAALLAAATAAAPAAAAQCPPVPEPQIPAIATPLNLDTVKDALRDYHDTRYMQDIAAVFEVAQSYVEKRAGEVKNPAVVLDIDETSLTNWPNLKADDFGFISDGRCDDLPKGPCGFNAWILLSSAPPIPPALKFFNAAKAKGIAIVFITGRRDAQRQATLWNLDQAGYEGYATLITRPDNDESKTVEEYKTKARAKVEADRNYTIIASIGDQLSDIEQQPGINGGRPECGFKVPNPFYFIK